MKRKTNHNILHLCTYVQMGAYMHTCTMKKTNKLATMKCAYEKEKSSKSNQLLIPIDEWTE